MIKPGYKTTEFWVTIGVLVFGLVLTGVAAYLQIVWLAMVGAAMASSNAIVYSVVRMLAKRPVEPTDAYIPKPQRTV